MIQQCTLLKGGWRGGGVVLLNQYIQNFMLYIFNIYNHYRAFKCLINNTQWLTNIMTNQLKTILLFQRSFHTKGGSIDTTVELSWSWSWVPFHTCLHTKICEIDAVFIVTIGVASISNTEKKNGIINSRCPKYWHYAPPKWGWGL
jgi:hypothetical protein